MKKTIKVYCPIKQDSNIKGYWKDNTSKVYVDNIIISRYTPLQFERIKVNLFNSGELAIFYIQDDIAYIQSKDTLQRLTRRTILKNIKADDIQGLLNQYGGLTYFIDRQEAHIWQK